MLLDDPRDDAPVVCERVRRTYRTTTGVVVALDDVDLVVMTGTFTAIAGPSGSGKSTLLAMVACTDRPDTGEVRVEGRDVAFASRRFRREVRRDRLGLVLPQPSDNLLERHDVLGNVRWALHRRRGAGRGARGADDGVAHELLDRVGLAHRADAGVRQLSGGEQQRVAVAVALAGGPSLVVADEPTASLDRASSADVVAALRAAVRAGATVLVATHDADVLAAADHVLHLDHGRVVA